MKYDSLIQNIKTQVEVSRVNVLHNISKAIVLTYWSVGKVIVDFEQQGHNRAVYGDKLLQTLSKDLSMRLGKGFSTSNLQYMRKVYLWFPNLTDASVKLTWSYYIELLTVSDENARVFYLTQAEKDNWSVRELNRQVNSMLYQRLSLSKSLDKEIQNANQNDNSVQSPKDIIKDPFVLEFLGLNSQIGYSEKKLEQRIIENLQKFLLELGKGFAFVARQYRISLDSTHFFVDLVFYHSVLKCYVLIDLKVSKANHMDIGQMNMYLNFFEHEKMVEGDNPPIGIVLCTDKNAIEIKYALGGLSNRLFVSRYKLYLPTEDELMREIQEI